MIIDKIELDDDERALYNDQSAIKDFIKKESMKKIEKVKNIYIINFYYRAFRYL